MSDIKHLLKLAVAGLPKCFEINCKHIATHFCEVNEMGIDCSYVYCDEHAATYMKELPYAEAVRKSVEE